MKRNSPIWPWVLLGVVLVGGGAYALATTMKRQQADDAGAWFETLKGPLVISVTESGTIKNREQVVIKNEVEGRVAILSLVKEGVHVEPGQLLVELDSSRLQEQKYSQAITVINAEASWVRARENLEVTRSQGEDDVAKAEQDVRFAKLDLEKYVQGEYPQQLQQADAEIAIAREEVERAKEKLDWSKRLFEQRYLSRTDLQADELALQKSKLDLELAEGRKTLLETYTHQRDLASLKTNIALAESALERTKRKAAADMVQAEAELRAKEQEHTRQKLQLAKLEDQIKKCRITAPAAGMVVYATTGRSSRWGGNDEPLQEGREVREREELIYLPTADSMMAEVKIHESNLEKVRTGMAVRVTVDAMPGKSWAGRIAKIGVLPDAQDRWMNPDLKLYNSEVVLEGTGGDLRTGMSCRAEIFVEQYADALSVPVQCVVRVGGTPRVYVKASGGPEPRDVKIGLDNNHFVHVVEGLSKGEPVLLNPPLEAVGPAPAEAPPDVSAVPAAEPAKETPVEKPAESAGAGEIDWSKLSPEERRKKWEELSPEDKRKMMEQFRQRGGGRGGERGGDQGER